MSFTTENTYTGNGTTTKYSFSFPYIISSDIKVTVDDANGVPIPTTVSIADPTTIQFTTPPANGRKVRIFRQTAVDNVQTQFFPGAAIRADDLNLNALQVLYKAQEVDERALTKEGGIVEGDIEFKDADIVFDGTTADNNKTRLSVVDPTTNQTYRLPNIATGGDHTLISNGDTGTVSTAMIAADAVNGTKIADNSIDSEHYVDGSIDTAHIADSNVTTAKIADSSVTTAKLANSNVTTAKIADANVTTAKIADANVTTAKIADSNVTTAKIADANVTTAKIADSAVTSAKIANSNITTAKIADANVTTAKIADANVTTAKIANDAVTADKLPDDVINSEHYAAASIDAEHIADSQITTNKIANDAVTNAKIADDSIDSEHYVDGSIDTAHIADSQITTAKLADSAVTGAKIANTTITSANLTADTVVTNAEQSNASVNDTSFFTTSASDGRYFRQDSTETITAGDVWSSSDSFVATTGAINARIIDLVDDVGGFTAIDDETSFPATNPQGNTGSSQLMSVKEIGTSRTATNGTVSIANGAGSSTVIINSCPATLPASFGMLVETTSTLHTYTFHRLVPKATEVTTVANNAAAIATAATNVADINNFADIYQISNTDPSARADTTSLQEGDLVYRTDLDVVRVYDGSTYSNISPDQATINDISIVADEIATFNDLGSITDGLVAESVGGAISTCADLIEGSQTFTVTVANGIFVIDGSDAPVLNLRKGWTYTFDVSDASNSNHPLRFRTGTSTAYTTGVTNLGTEGNAGATVRFVVPDSAPNDLRYYCTVHGNGMGNTITVLEDPITAAANASINISTVAANDANVTTLAGLDAEISRLGTVDAIADMAILGTTDVVADMAILGTTDVVADMNLLATNDVVADMALLANTDVIADMALLGTSDCVADMAILGTTDVVADLNTLATADIIDDLETCADNNANITTVANNIANVNTVAGRDTEISRLGTADAVADMAILGTTDVVADMAILATTDVVADLNTLGTADIVSDMNTLATTANVTAMSNCSDDIANINTVAGSIADVNRYASEYTISANAPGSPSEGDLWYDDTSNVLKYYNGTSFASLSAGISQIADDTSPEISSSASQLDMNSKNITEVGTIDGTNMALDFGTL